MSKSLSLALPVAYSLVSSKALEKDLLPFYDFPDKSEVIFIYQGINDTYLIRSATSKYILRIYRAHWKTFDQVQAELHLLLFLKEQGISVSYPLADKNGGFIHRIQSPEGERYATVFSFADGEKLAALNANQAFLFGRLMATIHRVTQGKQMQDLLRDYTESGILAGTLNAIQIKLGDYPEAIKKLVAMSEEIKNKFTPHVGQTLKSGICHGDPHHENIFIEPATNNLTIYDFDFSGNGYLLYDIGSFCFYERNNETNIASFLKGYDEILPLSQTERDLLPYFKVLMRLFHLGARSNNADGVKNPLWFPDEIVSKINDIEKELPGVRTN